jgi:hypothetical protein
MKYLNKFYEKEIKFYKYMLNSWPFKLFLSLVRNRRKTRYVIIVKRYYPDGLLNQFFKKLNKNNPIDINLRTQNLFVIKFENTVKSVLQILSALIKMGNNLIPQAGTLFQQAEEIFGWLVGVIRNYYNLLAQALIGVLFFNYFSIRCMETSEWFIIIKEKYVLVASWDIYFFWKIIFKTDVCVLDYNLLKEISIYYNKKFETNNKIKDLKIKIYDNI